MFGSTRYTEESKNGKGNGMLIFHVKLNDADKTINDQDASAVSVKKLEVDDKAIVLDMDKDGDFFHILVFFESI